MRRQQNYNENKNENKGRTTVRNDTEKMGRTRTTNIGRQREGHEDKSQQDTKIQHRRGEKHRNTRGKCSKNRGEKKTITTLLIPYTVGSELKKAIQGLEDKYSDIIGGKKSEGNRKRRG